MVCGARARAEGRLCAPAHVARRCRAAGGGKLHHAHHGRCDADGTMVAMTTTLLSSMGSRVVLPQTGILMNNGVMWFDPAPGPAELDRAGQAAAHQHVSGHPARRRQAMDRGGCIRRSAHHGGGAAARVVRRRFRHDAGGGGASAAHRCVRPRQGDGGSRGSRRTSCARLQADGPTEIVEHGVLPINFACPNLHRAGGRRAHRHQRCRFALVGGGGAGLSVPIRASGRLPVPARLPDWARGGFAPGSAGRSPHRCPRAYRHWCRVARISKRTFAARTRSPALSGSDDCDGPGCLPAS